jgi:hypothetical protein
MQLAGRYEFMGGRIVEYRRTRTTTRDEYFSVSKRRRRLAITAGGHLSSRSKLIVCWVVKLCFALAAPYDEDFSTVGRSRGGFIATRRHRRTGAKTSGAGIECLC